MPWHFIAYRANPSVEDCERKAAEAAREHGSERVEVYANRTECFAAFHNGDGRAIAQKLHATKRWLNVPDSVFEASSPSG
jgi:hypothetical protein